MNYALLQLRYNRLRPTGQPAEDVAINTLHIQTSDGGLSAGDQSDVMTAIGHWWDAIGALISDQVNLHEVRMYNLPATAGPLGDPAYVDTTPHQGLGSSAAELPPQCAISHTLKTPIRRRWGRIYLPGIVNGAVSYGRVNDAALSTLGNAFEVFGKALRNAGIPIVVWHRASWSPQPVETFTIDDVFDVQRRRRFGHAFHRHDGSFLE